MSRMMEQPGGLTGREVAERQKQYGENRLAEGKKVHPFAVFVSQFKDFLTMVLLGGTVISVLTGEYAEALTIAVIVFLNGVMSFVQEYRAEKTLDALRGMAAPKARVWRDGELTAIAATELVPDDIIQLEAGDRIPADAVVLESAGLAADESMLTGESVACGKIAFQGSTPPENLPTARIWSIWGQRRSQGLGWRGSVRLGCPPRWGELPGCWQKSPTNRRRCKRSWTSWANILRSAAW